MQKVSFQFLLLVCSGQWMVTKSTFPSFDQLPDSYSSPLVVSHLPSSSLVSPATNLDLTQLQNLPVVLFQPKNPLTLQLTGNTNFKALQNLLNQGRLLKLQVSAPKASYSEPNPTFVQSSPKQARGLAGNVLRDRFPNLSSKFFHNTRNFYPQGDFNFENQFQASESFLKSVSPNGLLRKFRGSPLNVFHHRIPLGSNPFFMASPTSALPTYLPVPPNHAYKDINSFSASNSFPLYSSSHPSLNFSPKWHQLPHHFGDVSIGDFAQGSDLKPSFVGRLMPKFQSSIPHHGGIPHGLNLHGHSDLLTSGSDHAPHAFLAAPSGKGATFIPSHGLRSQFAEVGQLEGFSSNPDMSSAFAEFVTADHSPAVTEGFANVGSSMHRFLKMLGMGVAGLGMAGMTGFGDHDTLESSPRAVGRSLDFFPGYGNQANLDDMDDMELFEEDITGLFNRNKLKDHTTAPEVTKDPDEDRVYDDSTKLAISEDKQISMTTPTEAPHTDPHHSSKAQPSSQPLIVSSSMSNVMKPQHPKDNHQMPSTSAAHSPEHATISAMHSAEHSPTPKATSSSTLTVHSSEQSPTPEAAYSSTLSTGLSHQHHYTKYQVSPTSATDPPQQILYPKVNYYVPATAATASPQHRKPPIIIYQGLTKPVHVYKPAHYQKPTDHPMQNHTVEEVTKKRNNTENSPPKSVSHLSHHKSDPNHLVNTDDVRPWVPITFGKGYVERRPVSIITRGTSGEAAVKEKIIKTFSEASRIDDKKAKAR